MDLQLLRSGFELCSSIRLSSACGYRVLGGN
jgi:hypothetical protein